MDKQLNVIFRSLSDTTRRDILLRLSQKELSVSEIAKPYKMSLAAISKHIKVLEKAKMIIRNRNGKKFIIKSDPVGVKPADDWITRYKQELHTSFDRMDAYLAKLKKGEKKNE